jgi:hypothetical protein
VANTIRWYDRNWTLLRSSAIGALSLIGGIYFDGLLYWITDQTGATGSVQAFTYDGGTFNRVVVWTLPTGYSAPTGITGDGLNLYVAATFTDAGPPVSVARTVLLFNKTGTLLRDLAMGSPTAVAQIDLDFNGANLVRCITGTATGEQIQLIDPPSGSPMYESPDLPRAPSAMTFDGQNFPATVVVAGNYNGTLFDYSCNVLQALVGIGATEPHGMCITRDEPGVGIGPDHSSGLHYAVAFRA